VPVPSTAVQDLVREYLLFHGYDNTLQSFELALHRPAPTAPPTEPPHPFPPESSSTQSSPTCDGDHCSDEEVGQPFFRPLPSPLSQCDGLRWTGTEPSSETTLASPTPRTRRKRCSDDEAAAYVTVTIASPSSDDGDRDELSITSQPSRQPLRPPQSDRSCSESESDGEDEEPPDDDLDDDDDEEDDEGVDYPGEDLMELEEEEEEEEEKDDLEAGEGEEDSQEESQAELAQQLHSALEELSQSHSNVRYINHVYNSPAAVRSGSVSSSLSSLVSGIRRVTAQNPRRVNPSASSSRRNAPSSFGAQPTNQRRQVAVERRRIFSLNSEGEDGNETKHEEYDSLSSSPILWRTSLHGARRMESAPTPLRSLISEGLPFNSPSQPDPTLAGSDGEHLRNELLLRKTLPLRSQSRQLLKQARFLPLPLCPLTALCR
jgi:hypothetical protein